jgi:hypothetical protein
MTAVLLPPPRGPLSDHLIEVLTARPGPVGGLGAQVRRAVASGLSVSHDEDVQLSLWLLYELHHRGLHGVDPRWEWSPDLIVARGLIEEEFERELRGAVHDRVRRPDQPDDVPAALFALVQADDEPSVSEYLARRGTTEQYREFLVHQSLTRLDSHSWAIPRLTGPAKAALLAIQGGEYGRAGQLAAAMEALDLHDLDRGGSAGSPAALPAATLARSNAVSMLGLHRRLLGAVAGHLAAVQLASALANARYARGVLRLGLPEPVGRFFDAQGPADALHEQAAARDLAGRLVQDEPGLVGEVFFGAALALHTEAQVAKHLLGSWLAGRGSLRGSLRSSHEVA